MVANARNHETSGSDIWLGPSEASVMPLWLPTIFRLAPEYRPISIWSYARVKNLLKVAMKGILPPAERPVPTPIMFCSAILHSKKRSVEAGSLRNMSVKVEFCTSASRTTTFLFTRPSARRPMPNARRVAITPDW